MPDPAERPARPPRSGDRPVHPGRRAADGRREPRPALRVARTADGLSHANTLELLPAFEVSL